MLHRYRSKEERQTLGNGLEVVLLCAIHWTASPTKSEAFCVRYHHHPIRILAALEPSHMDEVVRMVMSSALLAYILFKKIRSY